MLINMHKLSAKQLVEMNGISPTKAVGARDIDHHYFSISEDKLTHYQTKGLGREEKINKATETRKM